MKVSEKITAPNLAEMLTDCSIDRVMAIDTNMIVIAWNTTSEITSGIKKQDIIGRHIADALPQLMSNKEISNAIQQAMRGYKSFVPSDRECPELKYYESHFIPLKDNNEIIGVMNIMHDVAHRIKVEEQLQKLNRSLEKKYQELGQANKELGTFTYITSHELKEPLRHVYTSMEILITNEAQKFSNNSRANLRRIQSALSRMSLLLDDISALSQLSSFNKEAEEVNLADTIKKAKDILYEKITAKDAEIELSNLPPVIGYADMLEQLFVNLLDNALKFQPQDQKPLIKVEATTISGDDELGSIGEPGEQYLKVSVSDNGIGFEKNDLDRIFIMFERLHPKNIYRGSGMGLALCRKIMEAHNGFITAESIPGQGSVFHCYFPQSGGGEFQ